jgi:hypothetical protein
VGLALAQCEGRRFPTVIFAAILLHNTLDLWTRKHAQFVERAAPTTQLIEFARKTPGAMWIQCFPLPGIVAEEALRLAAGRSPSDLVWTADAAHQRSAVAFCYAGKR